MGFESAIGKFGSLVGDPTRARMLAALMDGRAYTATELAMIGEVAPSTASSHLDRLRRGGLLDLVRQGRHRYYRIAGPDVASAIEALAVASGSENIDVAARRVDPAMRAARLCYDHIAGKAGVDLFAAMLARGLLSNANGVISLSSLGERWLRSLGLEPDHLRDGRRPLCKTCLDWTERRDHLAGALGAALLEMMLVRAFVQRIPGSRALRVTNRGSTFIAVHVGASRAP